jgi:diacylglycerol kinase (ATP)
MLHHFIINPRWGRTRAGRRIADLEQAARDRKLPYRFTITKRPGHAVELTRRAVAEGAATLIAVGGDGTVHEVLNGLDDKTPLGIVPVGTCNDIAHSLGLPTKNWRAALDVIARGHVLHADVGRCGDRRFLSVAGMGLDSMVGVAANRLPHFLRARATYIPILLANLLIKRPLLFRIVTDRETIEQPAWMVAVANTEAYGGGMRIAPQARPDNGLFHVCIIGPISRLEFIRVFPLVYRGAHVSHPMVRIIEARRVRISCARRCPIIADGEPVGRLPASFEIEPRRLAVFA